MRQDYLLFSIFICISAFASIADAQLAPAVAFVASRSRGHRTYRSAVSSLSMAKKKKVGSAATKKIQVKLLKHVAGSGQAGEVIMVTPPFFNNKLRPTKLAVLISDEEVQKQQEEDQEKQNQMVAAANVVKGKLESIDVVIPRKAGPDGRLYGGVGPKGIMDEVNKLLPDEESFLGSKGVRIDSITDADGKKMRGDIKETGEFSAKLSLSSNISATFSLRVIETK